MKLAIQNDVTVSNDDVRQLDRAYVFPFVVGTGQHHTRW